MNKNATCNTKIIKSRGWTFTLNNYTSEDVKYIQTIPCKYCFQEETGKEGTKHLQGMLYFANATTFNHIKDLLPKAHIEKMKNLIASKKYCSKNDTRTGEIYTNYEDLKINTHLHSVQEKKKSLDELIKNDIEKNSDEYLIWYRLKYDEPEYFKTCCPEWLISELSM